MTTTPAPKGADIEQREESDFEAWWESDGQFIRAGGGKYEKSFAYQAWMRRAEGSSTSTSQGAPEAGKLVWMEAHGESGGYWGEQSEEDAKAYGQRHRLVRVLFDSADPSGNSGAAPGDALDAARWRAFRARDDFDDLDFTSFQDQFRKDADDVIDAAMKGQK